jgi:hypothetical protein
VREEIHLFALFFFFFFFYAKKCSVFSGVAKDIRENKCLRIRKKNHTQHQRKTKRRHFIALLEQHRAAAAVKAVKAK